MKAVVVCLVLLTALPGWLAAEPLKPYVLAGLDQGTVTEVEARAEAQLEASGFDIVGSYAPMGDEAYGVICLTHPLLKEAAGEAGGLAGLAAVLRVGLHQSHDGVEVAYMNPAYWGNAYFRKSFPTVKKLYGKLDDSLREAFAGLPDARFEPFGSAKGLEVKRLRKYHYMPMMPRFEDVVVLDKGTPFDERMERISARSQKKDGLARVVYTVQWPEKKMALVGLALTGEKGEKQFMPVIDFGEPKHTPFLPYELLVLDDRAVMLHGKYRIALSFPDLSMGTFMKIVKTPGNIESALKSVVAP